MARELDPLVEEYEHEKFRPREAEALMTLRKVASLVKPIMRQRGWRVGILTEFFPSEHNLLGLNWNKGQKICLRLRHAGDERQFIPIENVVDTMLHELCHIVHGPHNEAFHNLWNQLRDEHENLVRKGYTGEGFLSTGHRLGGARMPMHEARRQARAAAERRRTLTAGSGQKLGGAPVRRGQDMRRVIADAASRRLTVTRGCASEGTTKEREREIIEGTNKNGTRTKAEDEDPNIEAIMIAYIDLIQEEERERYGAGYIPPSAQNPTGSRGAPIRIPSPDEDDHHDHDPAPAIPSSTKPINHSQNPPSSSTHPSPSTSAGPRTWTCEICTLVNPDNYLCCDACTTERPSPPPSPFPSSSSPFPATSTQPSLPVTGATNSHKASIHDSNSKKAVRSLINLDKTTAHLPTKPMGWSCHQCGNWMEQQWWTCAACGAMKLTS